MIPFTFRFASGEEVKEIPSNWRDVSFDKFLGIYNLQKDHDVIDRISILSGIPVDKLRTCQSSSMILVIDEIKFCYDISEVLKAASTVPADEKWQKWSVGTEEWGKLEAVKQQFAVCDKQILDKFMIEGKPEWEDLPPEVIEAIRLNRLNAGPIALKEYAGIDSSKESVLDCYGLVNFFLLKSESFLNGSRSSVM
jgi:hypothetical protein